MFESLRNPGPESRLEPSRLEKREKSLFVYFLCVSLPRNMKTRASSVKVLLDVRDILVLLWLTAAWLVRCGLTKSCCQLGQHWARWRTSRRGFIRRSNATLSSNPNWTTKSLLPSWCSGSKTKRKVLDSAIRFSALLEKNRKHLFKELRKTAERNSIDKGKRSK